MLRDQLGHLKHAYRTLAAEDLLKLVISIDVALVLRILKVMLLDVYPKALHDLRTWHRSFADYCLKLLAERHGLHECRIAFCHSILNYY